MHDPSTRLLAEVVFAREELNSNFGASLQPHEPQRWLRVLLGVLALGLSAVNLVEVATI